MNIGLNAIGFYPGQMGGVETYFRNLVHYLQISDHENNYLILGDVRKTSQLPLFNPRFKLIDLRYDKPSFRWFVRKSLQKTVGFDLLKRVVNRLDLDVIHHPFTVLNPVGLNIPSVLTFWDMQQEFYPDFFSEKELHIRKILYRSSTEESDRIIVSSEFTKKCLVGKYEISAEKIDVIFTGYGHDYCVINETETLERVKSKYNLHTPFIYYPAATWPHKNHKALLNALKILKEMKGFDGQLVLTGIVMKSQDEIMGEIRALGLDENVKILGYLPTEELPCLYNLARLMVFPSLFEGFGIPLVEAMACGCPVLCSNVTSLPEVAGDAGVLFDPLSPNDTAEKIWHVWNDDVKLSQMKTKGLERVKLFRWEETAKRTIEVYQKAY